MKKLITLILLGFSFGAYAQLPVSQTPEKKRVVLEEFTGKTCVWCPAGHLVAANMKEEDPNNVFLINIHVGGYAAGTPNYRTNFGTAIDGQASVTGYPAGTVNRQAFGTSTGTSTGRDEWAENAETLKTQDAYVNVAVEATLDSTTRELIVNVEAYYTGDAPTTSNFLNVAITQDDIHGPQTGGATNNPGMMDEDDNYIHNHMLRYMMTGQWGEEITTVSTGDLVQKTYSYTLPAIIGDVDMDVTKLHIVAFMSETHQNIINGNGTEPSLTGLTHNLEAQTLSAVTPQSTCSASFDPEVNIINLGNTPITSMKIEYSANNYPAQTYDWTGNLLGGITEKIVLPTLSYNSVESNQISIKVVEVNGGDDDILTNNEVTAVVLEAVEYQTATMQLTFEGDQYSGGTYNETSWKLFSSDGTVLQEAAVGSLTDQAYDVTLNLPSYDCYTFEFYDSFGDGLTGSGSGTVSVDFNGTNVLSGSGSFSKLSASFATVDMNGNGQGNPTDNVDTTASGILDIDLVSNFNVFPNPSTDLVNIEIETTNNLAVQVQLFDILGRNVLSTELDNGKATLDVSNLNKGLYIVKATSQGKAIATSSIVVR